jgi:chitin synthase
MSIFYFAMFNALFVLIVFMLTLNKDTLHIDWPFGIKENITITEDNQVGVFDWFAAVDACSQ